MPAYQFNVRPDGVALATFGGTFEFDLPPSFFVTPLGLMTRGLVVGLGDQWRYANDSTDPSWAVGAAGTDPGWVVNDL